MKVYTKATPKLVELWKNYKGKKSGHIEGAEAFDNCDNEGNTGNFYACHTLSCDEYKDNNYTEVSEQEFIDVINNSLSKSYGTTPIWQEPHYIPNLKATLNGKKESDGKLPYELDWCFVEQMAERMQSNKHKYEPYNWKKPIDIDKLLDSLTRHFISVQKGIYEDDGRPFGHLEAISCISMMINYQLNNK